LFNIDTLLNLLTTVLAFVVVLGITVTIHEFGHFAMAKLLKIRVLTFSLGFGPKIFGFTRGDTEYRLSYFPLGGYVKMAGENTGDECKGNPDEFLSHPKWHRFLVAVSGPMMNILLAVTIFTFSFMQGVSTPRYLKEPAVLGPVTANTPARIAGLKTGDRVLSINRNPVNTWQDMELALETVPKNALNFEISRNNQILQLRIEPSKLEKSMDPGTLGFKFPLSRTIIKSVSNNTPASKAGLMGGDEILSVRKKDQIGTTYNQILNIISESKGMPLDFEVRRGDNTAGTEIAWTKATSSQGKILHFTVTPFEDNGHVIIGFLPDYPMDSQKYGLSQSFIQSIKHNYEIVTVTFTYIGRIFKGSASVESISGPIGIAKMSGEVARSAARTRSARVFFVFLAMISLQLGVFNLLPIPILDGGMIALLFIEGLLRRDLSLNLKEKIQQVAFVFLILLMGFVILHNDLKINQIFHR
jgi:regulator of sigma E protease